MGVRFLKGLFGGGGGAVSGDGGAGVLAEVAAQIGGVGGSAVAARFVPL